MKKQRVVVGMSGGVDSSVAALVLKKQGYEVIGLFMKNWDEIGPDGVCSATEDYEDVRKVCSKLEIPYYAVNFESEYMDSVFKEFLEDYKAGITPNPDILCNREIKFKHFFEQAKSLGADYLATGHYCQTNEAGELLRGNDTNKDQSYFLYTLKSEILKKVLFPIGNIEKAEVRKIAEEHGLATSAKKDSTGICFIGERNFKEFLSNYIQIRPGNMEDLAGNRVGRHDGIAFYTLGQRRGLGLGGPGEPWYVVDKKIKDNVLIVERGSEHPALFSEGLWASEISWVGEIPSFPFSCSAKIRYRQKDQSCEVELISEDQLFVRFNQPQKAIAPGQSIVFYDNERCLGGAKIIKRTPNYFELGKNVSQGSRV